MKIRDAYIMSVKLPRAHVNSLEIIAIHDGVKRSDLIRDAVKRLIAGRKAVLYPQTSQENKAP